jgi:hypothetical protein
MSNIGWASKIVGSFSDPCCCSAAENVLDRLSPLVGAECSPPASPRRRRAAC